MHYSVAKKYVLKFPNAIPISNIQPAFLQKHFFLKLKMLASTLTHLEAAVCDNICQTLAHHSILKSKDPV